MVYIGSYEILSHSETPDCSLRLIRVTGERSVERHLHEHSAQVYVVLQGKAIVSIEDGFRELTPYQSVAVPAGYRHGIRSEETALVLSISIPPLRESDQLQAA